MSVDRSPGSMCIAKHLLAADYWDRNGNSGCLRLYHDFAVIIQATLHNVRLEAVHDWIAPIMVDDSIKRRSITEYDRF